MFKNIKENMLIINDKMGSLSKEKETLKKKPSRNSRIEKYSIKNKKFMRWALTVEDR